MKNSSSKRAFEEYLNNQQIHKEIKYKHNRYHQRTRPYGTYLRRQDPIKFNANYEEWLREMNKCIKIGKI